MVKSSNWLVDDYILFFIFTYTCVYMHEYRYVNINIPTNIEIYVSF